MSSTKPGDVVLDPFFGTGTTGAVAKKLGRHFVGCEREQAYIDAATKRIASIDVALRASADDHSKQACGAACSFRYCAGSRSHAYRCRTDDSKGRHKAIVRADGTLEVNGQTGSIHKMGAYVQGLEACNGWTYWHLDRGNGREPIDVLRAIIRQEMAHAG